MGGADDMTRRLQELQRQEALRRTAALSDRVRDPDHGPDSAVARPAGQGVLTRARVQGQLRWYVAGRWIRTGETIAVRLGGVWVRGRFDWRATPTASPSLFIPATDPARDDVDVGLTLQVALAEGVIARFGDDEGRA